MGRAWSASVGSPIFDGCHPMGQSSAVDPVEDVVDVVENGLALFGCTGSQCVGCEGERLTCRVGDHHCSAPNMQEARQINTDRRALGVVQELTVTGWPKDSSKSMFPAAWRDLLNERGSVVYSVQATLRAQITSNRGQVSAQGAVRKVDLGSDGFKVH